MYSRKTYQVYTFIASGFFNEVEGVVFKDYKCGNYSTLVLHTHIGRGSLNILLPGTDYLAKAVDDDKCGSQEVTVRGVLSHDVLVPQLDGYQGPKQLAQLLDQQVEFTLNKRTQLETTILEEASLNDSVKLHAHIQVAVTECECAHLKFAFKDKTTKQKGPQHPKPK